MTEFRLFRILEYNRKQRDLGATVWKPQVSCFVVDKPGFLSFLSLNHITDFKSGFITSQLALNTKEIMRIEKLPSSYVLFWINTLNNSDSVSTYQVSSVQLVTNKKLEAFNKA